MIHKISEFELAQIWQLLSGKYRVKKINKDWELINIFNLSGRKILLLPTNHPNLSKMMRNFETLHSKYADVKASLFEPDPKLKKHVKHKTISSALGHKEEGGIHKEFEFEINTTKLKKFFEEKLKLFKEDELRIMNKDFKSYEYQRRIFLNSINKKLENCSRKQLKWKYPSERNSEQGEYKNFTLLLNALSFELDGYLRINEICLVDEEISIDLRLEDKINPLLGEGGRKLSITSKKEFFLVYNVESRTLRYNKSQIRCLTQGKFPHTLMTLAFDNEDSCWEIAVSKLREEGFSNDEISDGIDNFNKSIKKKLEELRIEIQVKEPFVSKPSNKVKISKIFKKPLKV